MIQRDKRQQKNKKRGRASGSQKRGEKERKREEIEGEMYRLGNGQFENETKRKKLRSRLWVF